MFNRISCFLGGTCGKEPACQCWRGGRHGFDPWVGTIPWRRKCHPLQYSCLENSTGRGTWQATVHGVAKSWTRLSMHAKSKPQLVSHGMWLCWTYFTQRNVLKFHPCCCKWQVFLWLNNVVLCSLFSTSLPALVISCLFNNIHSNRYEVISLWF